MTQITITRSFPGRRLVALTFAVVAAAALLIAGACSGSGASQSRETAPPADRTASSPTPVRPGPATAVPGATGTPLSASTRYEVQPGDTLFDIAQRFGVRAEAIALANSLADPGRIRVGQVLVIPGAGPPPTSGPSPSLDHRLTGFTYPIEGACLPGSDNLMPNAPREYRSGVHEGVDFYTGYNCVEIALGTHVLAVKAGKVVRADTGFAELTPEELDELLARSRSQGYTDEAALDRFRGRQVWVDHGDAIVTRYSHLSGIAPRIQAGAAVRAGQILGYVGDSGTPEAVTAPGSEIHLHFEIRVGNSFLGADLPADDVRAIYERAFSPS